MFPNKKVELISLLWLHHDKGKSIIELQLSSITCNRGVKTISNFRMEFWHPPKSVLLGIPIKRINLILFSKYETPRTRGLKILDLGVFYFNFQSPLEHKPQTLVATNTPDI